MSNTITRDGPVLNLSTLSSDWIWTATFPEPSLVTKGIPIDWILFVPGAQNDKLVFRRRSSTGVIVAHMTALNTGEMTQYFYGATEPLYLAIADCTLSAGHLIVVHLWPGSQIPGRT